MFDTASGLGGPLSFVVGACVRALPLACIRGCACVPCCRTETSTPPAAVCVALLRPPFLLLTLRHGLSSFATKRPANTSSGAKGCVAAKGRLVRTTRAEGMYDTGCFASSGAVVR